LNTAVAPLLKDFTVCYISQAFAHCLMTPCCWLVLQAMALEQQQQQAPAAGPGAAVQVVPLLLPLPTSWKQIQHTWMR
jgi:hypothetical protein